jgi:hypothetical protein
LNHQEECDDSNLLPEELVSRNEQPAGNSLLVITVPAGTDRVTRNTPEASP